METATSLPNLTVKKETRAASGAEDTTPPASSSSRPKTQGGLSSKVREVVDVFRENAILRTEISELQHEKMASSTRPGAEVPALELLSKEDLLAQNVELKRRLAAAFPKQDFEKDLLPLDEHGYEALLSKVHTRLGQVVNAVRLQSEASRRHDYTKVGEKGRDSVDAIFRITANLEKEMVAEQQLFKTMRLLRESREECSRLKVELKRTQSELHNTQNQVKMTEEIKKNLGVQLTDKTSQVVRLLNSNTKTINEYNRLKVSIESLQGVHDGSDQVKKMLLVQLRNAEHHKEHADLNAKQIRIWEKKMLGIENELGKRTYVVNDTSSTDIQKYNFIKDVPAAAKVRDFMTYITATDGYFPHFFLNDLSTKDANRCIEVMCSEFAGYYSETNRLMQLGRACVAPRLLDDDLEPATVWSRVCADARALLECEASTLWLVDGDTSWTLRADGTPHYMPVKGFHKAVVADREAIHLNDAYEDERFDREADKMKATRTGSILCQPVVFADPDHQADKPAKVVAILESVNKSAIGTTFFSRKDRLVHAQFANFAYACVRLARRRAQLANTNKRQKVVLAFGDNLLTFSDRPSMLLRRLEERMRELFDARKVSLCLNGDEHLTLCRRADQDDDPPVQSQVKISGIVGRVVTEKAKKPLVVHGAKHNPTYLERVDGAAEKGDMLVVAPIWTGSGADAMLSATLSWSSRPSGPDNLPLTADESPFQASCHGHQEALTALLFRVGTFVEKLSPCRERLPNWSLL